jgi:hypothetical protein
MTQPGDGWGDLHLQAAGYEISFASEDVGWQVSFVGDAAGVDTDELVAQVARQVQHSTGTATEWIRIT